MARDGAGGRGGWQLGSFGDVVVSGATGLEGLLLAATNGESGMEAAAAAVGQHDPDNPDGGWSLGAARPGVQGQEGGEAACEGRVRGGCGGGDGAFGMLEELARVSGAVLEGGVEGACGVSLAAITAARSAAAAPAMVEGPSRAPEKDCLGSAVPSPKRQRAA
jgi:hypothetical protein